ncbi:MAG: hydroxymethylglutaryl-CoA reductase, degradative [Aigarchaeota archaeon]|nr:hydroxymethylglutaryl-CoA reductase, degradative [Aigarchaeota archaeon]
MSHTSRISGLYRLPVERRLQVVRDFAGLTDEEAETVYKSAGLELETADRMIENVIGTMKIPMGIAANFLINGREHLVPMAIEEPSVVAAASNAAKITRAGGGIRAQATEPLMIGQIQLVDAPDPQAARLTILNSRREILKIADEQDPVLVRVGGGARDIDVRVLDTETGPMVITHLLVHVCDALGSNTVDTMAEAVAPLIEDLTGGKVYLRIVSNLADRRLVRARTRIPREALGGEDVVDGIVCAQSFAAADPYRAATHNKGIMNGVVAVALATGNDTRALEAGAHAYAAKSGVYKPLTDWRKNSNGDLVGTLEMPMAVGIVGGATKVNPVARAALKILQVQSASQLAEVMGAVGLAQNLAALRALATEGIQRGHMALHARNIAITAGANEEEIDKIVEQMVAERKIRIDRARELLNSIRQKSK